jgi:MFS family permease
MQNILGYSATQAGATFLPMTVLIVLIAPAAGRLSDRIGSRWLMGSGMTLLGCSLLLFSRLDQTSTFWTVLPGLLVGGLGMGLTMTPATAAGMGSVPVDKAGVGSAVLNSMRQVGGTLGIAVMGAIVASYVTVVPTDARYPAEFVTGFQRGLEVSAGIAFAAAILAVLTVRKDKQADAGDLAAAVAAAGESPQEARAA